MIIYPQIAQISRINMSWFESVLISEICGFIDFSSLVERLFKRGVDGDVHHFVFNSFLVNLIFAIFIYPQITQITLI